MITEQQMKDAAKAALESMGSLGTMPICLECGQCGDHDHTPVISRTLLAATFIGLVMVAAG